MQVNLYLEEKQVFRHSALLGICGEAESGMANDHRLWCQTQNQIPALLLIICVTLYNFLGISEPQTLGL